VYRFLVSPSSDSEFAIITASSHYSRSQSQKRHAQSRAKICRFNGWHIVLIIFSSCCLPFALSGCGGKIAINGSNSGTLTASPNPVTFGSVSIGQTASAAVSLVNGSSGSIQILQLNLTGQSFSVDGPINLPITIAAGGTYGLNLQFSPTAAGTASGQLTITSNSSATGTLVIGLSGTGTTATSEVAVSALSCNNASMMGSGTDACMVTLNAAAPSGGFSVSLSSNGAAVTVPATVTVPTNATSAGFTATVSSVATAQVVTLTATAGSVSKTFAIQLSATGPTLTLATSSSPSTYGSTVAFTATISGGFTGTVTFYDGSVSIGTGAITGTTATLTSSSLIAGSHTITASWPGNSSYGAVTSAAIIQVVNKATPAITWADPAAIISGTALSVTQLDASSTVPGAFVYSPAAGTVLALGSQTLSVTFTPTDTADYNTAKATVTLIVYSSTPTLSINATSVGFGTVTLNTVSTQTLTLTSTGAAPVTVSSATVTGTGFSLVGSTFSATLTLGQTATISVQFDPTTASAATGQLTIISNSSINGTALIPLSGTGTASSYSVDLSWVAPSSSSDPVAGYNIFRELSGSSAYQLLNSSVETGTTYVDSTVEPGQTYDYIVESVDASGIESVPTSPIAVTIP
jgi:hypothetical protein